MQLPSNDNMASRADAPHTQTAAEKFGEEKFSERKEKIERKGRLKGHFDASTAFLPEKDSLTVQLVSSLSK